MKLQLGDDLGYQRVLVLERRYNPILWTGFVKNLCGTCTLRVGVKFYVGSPVEI